MSKVNISADEIMAEKEMALRNFFPLETLTFKVGAKLKDGSKGKTLTYLDCSAVRARLDDVLGANNWKNDIQLTVAGIVCKLSIRYTPEGEWIERSNAAGAEGDFTTGFGYLVAQCFDRAFCRTASASAPAARNRARY